MPGFCIWGSDIPVTRFVGACWVGVASAHSRAAQQPQSQRYFTPISAMIPNIVSANRLFATQRV